MWIRQRKLINKRKLVELTLFTLGGAMWPPLVKIAPEQKIGPGRRPGLLGL